MHLSIVVPVYRQEKNIPEFSGGVQLINVGISGEYSGRIGENVRARPHLIVGSTAGIEDSRRDPLFA